MSWNVEQRQTLELAMLTRTSAACPQNVFVGKKPNYVFRFAIGFFSLPALTSGCQLHVLARIARNL